jgi:glycosyltransferase involved in cell wall biosynthesis
MSISPDFLKWAQDQSNRPDHHNDIVVYLTAETIKADEKNSINLMSENKSNQFTFLFIGSFMEAFNFSIFETLILDARKKNVHLKIIVAGNGNQLNQIEELENKYLEISYIGWVESYQIQSLLIKTDAFIMPLKQRSDFALSIPNKAMDAMRSGRMIFTSCKGSLSEMLDSNNCGFYIDPEKTQETIKKIIYLINNPSKKDQINRNAKIFYKAHFDHQQNYARLVKHFSKHV